MNRCDTNKNDSIKVLIVNGSLIGDDSATGTSMKNMLFGINNVTYRQICTDYRVYAHESSICNTLFVDERDTPFVFFIKRLIKRKDNSTSSVEKNPVILSKWDAKYWFFTLISLLPIHISSRVKQFAKEFKPDLIYTMGGNPKTLRFSIELQKILGCPIVFHCMDDWPSTAYDHVGFKLLRNWYLSLFNRLLEKTIVNLAISNKMASAYHSRYNKRFVVASNCSVVPSYVAPKEDGIIRLVYSGGVHSGRDNSLGLIAKALKNNEDNIPVKLDIFLPHKDVDRMKDRIGSKDSFDNTNTAIYPYIDKDKQLENLRNADVLLHVESFDETSKKYFALSFSTKLAEYMAAGRPIIVFGPKELASVQLIEENDIGWVIENEDDICTTIQIIYQNPNLVLSKGLKAYNLAKEFYAQDKVQERIYSVFNTINGKSV